MVNRKADITGKLMDRPTHLPMSNPEVEPDVRHPRF